MSRGGAAATGRRCALLLAAALPAAAILACGRPEAPPPPAPPPKHFPSPIYDGLALGMTREQAGRVHPMRPSLTAHGKDLKVWIYTRPGEGTVHLSFTGRGESDSLRRIDVHYGLSSEGADAFIARFEKALGPPDVRRRQAEINAYGDPAHDQFDTIWSDADQYLFFTERVPHSGRPGKPAYYMTVRRKQLAAKGPPTGYIPPPAVDENGKPIEEPVF